METGAKQMRALGNIFNASSTGSDPPTINSAKVEQRQTLLWSILKRGQETGKFRSHDIRAMADAIIGAIDSIPLLQTMKSDLDLGFFLC
jgi:hypothetical protein